MLPSLQASWRRNRFRRPIVSDYFDRTDSATSLGTADTGQVWTAHMGTWGINSQQAYSPVLSGGSAIASLDSGVSDGVVGLDFSVMGGTPSHSLLVRLIDVDNFLMARWNQTGGAVELFKRDAGVYTSLASVAKAGSGAHRLYMPMSGSAIIVRVDGVQQISHTLSAADQTKYGAATRVGIRAVGTDGRFDNLLVER